MRMRSLCFIVLMVALGADKSYSSSAAARDYFREGFVASTARQWDNAIALYSKSIELNASDAEVYVQRAINLEMANRTDEALADYEKAIQLQPNYYLALEYLARLYETKGQYKKALDLYTRALPLVTDPKWRSVVTWWIFETKKKAAGGDKPAGIPSVGTSSR